MTKWDAFFNDKVKKILTEKRNIIDIGGGLRVLKNKGDKHDPSREWIRPYLEKVNYKILDIEPSYNPDIIGDIHALPLPDESVDAIVCIAVLQHVKNPAQAVKEMYRTLKKGGYCFVYVPFLYAYHARPGQYCDYWRYTEDTIKMLFEDFEDIEYVGIREATEMWIYLSPLRKIKVLNYLARGVDKFLRKSGGKQVSGYNIFLRK